MRIDGSFFDTYAYVGRGVRNLGAVTDVETVTAVGPLALSVTDAGAKIAVTAAAAKITATPAGAKISVS